VPRCSLKRTLVDRGICLSLFSQHILGRSEEKLQLGWLCYCAYSFMCRIGHPTASWLVLLLWIFLPVPYSRMHYGKPLCWNLKACLEPLLILPHLASLAQQSKDNLCSRGRANFLLRWQGNPYLGGARLAGTTRVLNLPNSCPCPAKHADQTSRNQADPKLI
jgi:hypothetical protein